MVSMHIFFLSHMSYTISFVVFLEVIPFMLFQVNDNNRHRENYQMAFIYIVFSKELFSLKEFHILSNVGVLIYITTKYFLLHFVVTRHVDDKFKILLVHFSACQHGKKQSTFYSNYRIHCVHKNNVVDMILCDKAICI